MLCAVQNAFKRSVSRTNNVPALATKFNSFTLRRNYNTYQVSMRQCTRGGKGAQQPLLGEGSDDIVHRQTAAPGAGG